MSLKRLTRPSPSVADFGYSYSLGATSGIIPATPLSNKEVFQFRWNPTNRNLIAVIRKIEVSAAVSTTYFAAGVPVELTLARATSWSVAGTLGTAITPAATGKMDIGASGALTASTGLQDGDARIAGTDANGLGAGTKTIEANNLASILSGAPITSSLSGQIFPPGTELLRGRIGDGDYPLVLRAGAAAANAEGFIIRATAPATGTWRLSVNVSWDEVTDWPYSRSFSA